MLHSNSNPVEPPSTAQGWTPREISAALGKGGKARIARRAHCDDSAVGHVVHGRCRSRRLEGMIAQALHVPASEIFPVRIEEEGPPTDPIGEGHEKGAAA